LVFHEVKRFCLEFTLSDRNDVGDWSEPQGVFIEFDSKEEALNFIKKAELLLIEKLVKK
jgi:hypothetical protein